MATIVFEDEDILLINKAAGELSQNNFVVDGKQFDSRANLLTPVHRLDQRVSGLLLLAKNKESISKLSEDFRNHKINKYYKAVVAVAPPKLQDKLTHWILKDVNNSKAKIFANEVAHSKKCILTYQLVQSSLKYHLLKVELFTGRFHQIRAQMASIGCPIVGDLKYGYKRSSPDKSIFLQSYAIKFTHPKTEKILIFEIPMPELWKKFGLVEVND